MTYFPYRKKRGRESKAVKGGEKGGE